MGLGSGLKPVEQHTILKMLLLDILHRYLKRPKLSHCACLTGLNSSLIPSCCCILSLLVLILTEVELKSLAFVQVYPNSWTAILVSLDNQGIWNLRSAIWEKQYLGQQVYLRVYTPTRSLANEYDIPTNVLLCGKAVGKHP